MSVWRSTSRPYSGGAAHSQWRRMSMTAAQLRVAALLMQCDDEMDVSYFQCD